MGVRLGIDLDSGRGGAGAMALVRMPWFRYITARDLVSPTMPCLEAVYAAPAVLPRRPASDAVNTIEPLPAASMCGSAARVSWNGAVRLTRMTRSHSASPVSASADMWSMTPALFTSTSRPPKVSTAVATTSSTTRGSLRSPTTARATPPAYSMVLTTCSAASSFRSATRTFAPSSANSRAVARPMPEPAPVTTTPRPSSPVPVLLMSYLSLSLGRPSRPVFRDRRSRLVFAVGVSRSVLATSPSPCAGRRRPYRAHRARWGGRGRPGPPG